LTAKHDVRLAFEVGNVESEDLGHMMMPDVGCERALILELICVRVAVVRRDFSVMPRCVARFRHSNSKKYLPLNILFLKDLNKVKSVLSAIKIGSIQCLRICVRNICA
jgi:hypothetical protein